MPRSAPPRSHLGPRLSEPRSAPRSTLGALERSLGVTWGLGASGSGLGAEPRNGLEYTEWELNASTQAIYIPHSSTTLTTLQQMCCFRQVGPRVGRGLASIGGERSWMCLCVCERFHGRAALVQIHSGPRFILTKIYCFAKICKKNPPRPVCAVEAQCAFVIVHALSELSSQ